MSAPFTLTYHLTVTGINPTLAPSGGGDELVVTGAGFGAGRRPSSWCSVHLGSVDGEAVLCV